MPLLTRSQIFEKLGVVPTNSRWAWCALHPENKFAVFTVWKDEIRNRRTRLTSSDPQVAKRLGAVDQERIAGAVIELEVPAYALICEAADVDAVPRSIERINGEYLTHLRLERTDGVTYAHHGKRIHVLDVVSRHAGESSALDDLPRAAPRGTESPDRALRRSGMTFKRDAQLREHVIRRANDRCEYCGRHGFLMPNGSRYIEAHHIIALCKQGPDTLENVIALCPEHHREAHFGAEAERLEVEFLQVLNRLSNS